jgi:hypothetical protein
MRTATLVLTWIVRIAGIGQILLGLSIWIGPGLRLLSLHLLTGCLIVVCLWILAVLALIVRGRPALAAFAIGWGLVLPAFGMAQSSILIGPLHWIIQVVHLLMGLIALGTADALSRHILMARAGRSAGSSPSAKQL